jgi:hypothetical protein
MSQGYLVAESNSQNLFEAEIQKFEMERFAFCQSTI